jgi:hypothetical protein
MLAKVAAMQYYIYLILNQNVITFNKVDKRIKKFAKKENDTWRWSSIHS